MAKNPSPAPKRALKPKYPLWLTVTVFAVLAALVLSFILFFCVNRWTLEVTPNGGTAVTVEYGDTYQEDGASALLHGSPFFKKGWTVNAKASGDVDTDTLGDYTVTYTARKLFWKSTAERTVTVCDTTPPEITLVADPDAFTVPGTEYQEEGFTAVDNHDGDITDQVKRTVKDDKIIYTVTDSSGNKAKVKRKIYYHDPSAPKLTLKGDAEITIQAGEAWKEPGWSAIDNVDGEVSDNVSVSGTVDYYTAGTYTLTYTVSDTYGNEAKATRTVIVEPLKQTNVTDPGSKVIYLTFDDGPGRYTQKLLDILDKYNVKATFFLCDTGRADLIKKEYEAGHSVAIHSATHKYSEIYASKDNYFKDLEQMSDIIYNATGGYRTKLLRFPGGSSNTVSKNYCSGIMSTLSKAVTDQGYAYFDWNVLSGDAGDTESTDEVVKNVTSRIAALDSKPAVVLQHDIYEFSVNAVERIIIWGLENGYTFLPLDTSSPTAHQTISN